MMPPVWIAFSFIVGAAFGQTGTLWLQVEGVRKEKGGQLSAGIFSAENFPKVGRQLRGKEVAVTDVRMEIVITDVPAGYYGVAVYQDIDKNGDLKTNWVGLPQEPIGFSNDARIRLGPPSFEDAKIEIKSGQTLHLSITLR